MHLHHIHFPSANPIPYTHALQLQEVFARQHLNHKALVSSSKSPPAKLPAQPTPKLLTFSSNPVYTTGIREAKSLTSEQISILTGTGAAHHSSPRGGLTTYHGPGQLTAFLISTLATHGLTPRCHVHFLEDAVIKTAAIYGVRGARWSSTAFEADGITREDESRPGVWTGFDSKLCSIGIHFRRGVSSFGIGFNITDEVKHWFERIVACGIPDSKAVSLEGEQERLAGEGKAIDGVDGVVKVLANVVADGLEGVEGVQAVDVRELGEMTE